MNVTVAHDDPPLIVRHADVLIIMDAQRREIPNGALVVRGGTIEWVGAMADLPSQYRETIGQPNVRAIELCDHVVTPGFVNTHYHMYQSLVCALPAAQNVELSGWLTNLYPVWAGPTPEMVRVSVLAAMAEPLLSGCTISSDHLYLYPNGSRLDDLIGTVQQIDMRFHAVRGNMSVSRSQGGLPPDHVVEGGEAILKETQHLIETWHNVDCRSMLRVVVAPCSPLSASRDLMRESAKLARSYGVSMHTRLAENDNDIAYSREKFGMTPAEYAEDLGWVGRDVWHAHCVKLDAHGIDAFACTGTGVAHCPCSNMHLTSGIASIRTMRDAGAPVGFGADGSASNDGAHTLGEVRQAMLFARVGFGSAAMSAREALEIVTLGGMRMFNRDDIGVFAPGISADFVSFDRHQVGFAGADHDPVAALVFCAPSNMAHSVINGRVVVEDGRLTTLELDAHLTVHWRLVLKPVQAARAVPAWCDGALPRS